MQLGALDFAGGAVVHLNSGIAALALILVLGKRKDTRLLPHNLGYAVIGAALLWFGWFGFNGGSALGANGLAAIDLYDSAIAVYQSGVNTAGEAIAQFGITANPTAQGVVSILALVANVICISVIIKRSIEQKKNPYKEEIFAGTRDYIEAMERAE